MITIPSFSEILSRLRNDFQNANQTSNPFLRTGFLKSLLDTHAGRYLDIYRKITDVINEFFISTASEDGLRERGNENSLAIRSATKSVGGIIATGVIGETISSGEQFVSSSGDIFSSTSTSTILTEAITITSITQSAGVAIVTAAAHGMASGFDVTISGAVEAGYNGTFTIEATSADTFTYSVPTATISPATGTIAGSTVRATINIEADVGGVIGNLLPNENLDFVVTSPNINSETAVIYPGLSGGADDETTEEFRSRLLDFVREPVAPFNVANIDNAIKVAVPTASRVFVNEITPAAGQVTIYFVEDSQESIIPSSVTLTKAKDSLESIRPASVDVADVFVVAPTLVSNDFTFTSIVPDTSSMRSAITANLQFLFNNTIEGTDITADAYKNAIINSVDTQTGASLSSFTLSAPAGDITISAGELGTLGNVTF